MNLRPVSIATVVLAVLAIGAVLVVLKPILIPFVLAGLLSILFRPLVQTLRRWRVPMALCLVVVLAVTGGALWAMYSISAAGVNSAIEKAPEYQQKINALTLQVNSLMRQASVSVTGRSSSFNWDKLIDVSTITSAATSITGGVISVLGDSTLVLLFLVFMLLASETFPKKLDAASAALGWLDVRGIYDSVNRHVLQYLRVKSLFNIANGVATWLILLAFGTDFAALMGLLSFLLHYLPNIGSLISTVLPFLIALVQTGSITEALFVLAVLVVAQNIIGNVIEPRVMGDSLDLSPVLVLFSLALWGWMWGIVGMIISVPLMAIVKTILEAFPATRSIALLMGSKVPDVTTSPNTLTA